MFRPRLDLAVLAFLGLFCLPLFCLPRSGPSAELDLGGDWKPSDDGTVLAFVPQEDGTWSLVVKSLPPGASVDAKKRVGSAVVTGLRWNPQTGRWTGRALVGTVEIRPQEGFQEVVMTVNLVLFSKSMVLTRLRVGATD